MRTIYSLFLVFLVSMPAFALDKNDEQALKETQNLLSDEKALAEFTKGNPAAANALDQVKIMTGGDATKQAEIKNISSSIFTDMVKANNGDPAAIQSQLQNALKDPQAFMKSLSPEQQKRIRDLASELEKKNAAQAAEKK
ncbi:MAG TPA: hypothetical protein VIH99_11580 [Bdellovibrionota bacterium]